MMRSRLARSGPVVLLVGLCLAVLGSGQAQAATAITPGTHGVAMASSVTVTVRGKAPSANPLVFPPTGYHAFTPQSPSWSFGDGYGSGAEQINYSTSYEQWGYQLSPSFRAGIIGNVVENANLYCGGSLVTNYGQHTVAPSYQFHGSRGGINTTCNYRTIVTISYQTSSGGGQLTAQWNWYKTLV